MAFGLPGTGAATPGKGPQYLPNQGHFAIPTGVQRIAEQGLWSTYRFAAGTAISGTVPRFFAVQIGAQGQGFTAAQLSISETNQQVANQAPGDETYEVSAISAEVYGATNVAPLIADVRLLQRLAIMRWEFGSVLIDIAPLSMVGAGGGIFGFSADAGTPVTAANNGNGTLWVYTNVVIAIPATQRFAIIMPIGTAGQAAGLAPTNETQVRLTLFNMARSAVPQA